MKSNRLNTIGQPVSNHSNHPHFWGSEGGLALLGLLLVFLVLSCRDDDGERIPSYITNLLVASTNSEGLIYKVKTDDGLEYVLPSPSVKAQVADTTYRCIATYTTDDNGFKLYGIQHIFSPLPRPAESFTATPSNPVRLLSIWQGGDYINLCLGIMTNGGGEHKFAFCIDSIVGNTEYVSLLHDRRGDSEAYTEKVYMSMPMQPHDPFVEHFVMRVPTYDGVVIFDF